jgi:hypothetical protein
MKKEYPIFGAAKSGKRILHLSLQVSSKQIYVIQPWEPYKINIMEYSSYQSIKQYQGKEISRVEWKKALIKMLDATVNRFLFDF